LHQEIREVFSYDRFLERGYFNQARVLDIYDRYCSGKLNRPERQFYGEALWRILNLELWLEVFFDPQAETTND
jgi:hypothetical protein